MKAVFLMVLEKDPNIESPVLPYVDDLCVNEDVVSAERVIERFVNYIWALL